MSPCLWSQDIPQNFLFDHYGPREGLVSAQVLALAKAPDGHLWLGTEKGLLSFDANDFKSWIYNADDPGSISGNYISSLIVDRHGRIWIIASEFLNVFDPATGIFQNVLLPGFDKLPLFHGLYYDHANDVVWITTRKGIYYNQGKHLAPERQDLDGISPGTFFNALIPESKGIVYLANTYGLYAFETAACRVTTYHRPGKNPTLTHDDGFYCANMDTSGIIWLGSWTHGLVRFDPQTRDMENYTWTNPRLQQNAVVSLCHFPVPGQPDLIWLCTNQGIKTFDYATKTFVSFNTENYFDPSKIPGAGFSILPTKTDGLWMGTFKGLHRYDPDKQQFRKVRLPKPLPTEYGKIADFKIYGSAGKDSILWLSIHYGDILKYDLQKQKTLPLPPVLAPFCLASNSIHVMFFDQLHQLWISSDKRGVIAYNEDKSTVTIPQWQDVPPGEKMLCIAEDNEKKIWMGGLQGLYEYNQHTNHLTPAVAFNQYIKSSKLMPGIGQMAFDQKNRIWFILVREGSEIRIPVCYDPTTQQTFIPNSLSTIKKLARLEALAIGKDGRLIITGETGFITAIPGDFDLESIEFYGTDKSEFLAGSHHVLIENEARVWLSSDFGISCYNSGSGVVSHFTYLNSSIGNTPQPMMVLSADQQRLWIAQNGYLDVFSMENLNMVPSDSIRLTRISLPNGDIIERMTSGSELKLNHLQNNLELRFSNFNFTNARDTRYQYRFSKNSAWLPMKGNTLRFDNLGPSTYPLEVRAINSMGKISGNVFSLQIIILPPFWKTWWFFTLVALVPLAMIYIFFTFREKQRNKMEMLRQNIARDLHDDMGSNLSQIKIISEMEAIKGSHERFGEIAEKLTEVMATMSEIVWSINPLYDSFDDALLKIKEFAIEMLEPRGINLRFEAATSTVHIKLNTSQRRHLYLIFKESINNIAKYAKADEVVFSVASQNQKTIISIKDNGIGFDTLHPGSGNGLNNMKTRAIAIGADLSIHSGTQGTEIVLVMSQ